MAGEKVGLSNTYLLLFFLAYIFFCAGSISAVIFVLLSEMYPTKIRGLAMSVAGLSLWIGTYLIGQLTPWMLETLTPGGTFFLFAFMCLPYMLIVWKLMPETAGKTLEEIELFWTGQNVNLNKKYLMRHILCILLSVFGLTTGMTQHLHQIRGTVFCENKGICGVVVSDGKNCVQTDKQGNYSLNIDNESRFVFISTPSGYLTEIKENTIPLFYKPIDRSADKNYNFHLKKNPHDDLNHVFFAQADVQAIRPENLETYHTFLNDYQEELASYRNTDIFGIDCGDITGDNAQLFPPYIEAIKSLNIPVYRAIGNHDMDYNGRSFETSQHSFESFLVLHAIPSTKVKYTILF